MQSLRRADLKFGEVVAIYGLGLVGQLCASIAKAAGCVVVGIDSQTTPAGFKVQQFTGDLQRTRDTGRSTLDWVTEVERRGAGEIVLNCMASDGVRRGYDIEQLCAVRAICRVPLVASGGAGSTEHFRDVFLHAGVDAALAASVFHSGAIAVADLKRDLASAGIAVRPPQESRQ